VRVAPDNTIAAFNGLPDEGTLLREWSDAKVWRIMDGVRRWVTTPTELVKWGGFLPYALFRTEPCGHSRRQLLPRQDERMPGAQGEKIGQLNAQITQLQNNMDNLEGRKLAVAKLLQMRLAPG